MTVESPLRLPQTTDVILNEALYAAGLQMRAEDFPGGRRRYAVWGRRGVVGILDPNGKAFERLPGAWLMELRETELDGDPVGEPIVRQRFRVAEADEAAAWAKRALDALMHDVRVPDPLPIEPPAAAAPTWEPAAYPAEEEDTVRHSARRRKIRPGRRENTKWPATVAVDILGPDRPEKHVRTWQVRANKQLIGRLVARRYPLPDPTWWQRNSRVQWHAYFVQDGLQHDVTGTGRESREGAVAMLVAFWQSNFRGIGTR